MRLETRWGWIEVTKEGNRYIIRYDGSPDFVELMKLLTPCEKLTLARFLMKRTGSEIRKLENLINESIEKFEKILDKILSEVKCL